MSSVQRFVAENSIDAEVFNWLEAVLCQFVKHSCTDCCAMCPEQILLGLFNLPVVSIPLRAIATLTVYIFHFLQIIQWKVV